MAAAYAALLSLFHVLENVKLYARRPISFNKTEKDLIETLRGRISFLIDFVENYSNGGCKIADGFQSRIRDAAHAAEDIIESHIVDQILDGSTSSAREKKISTPFSRGLERMVRNMDSIKKDMVVLKTKEEERIKDQPPRRLKSMSSTSSPAFSSKENNAMVGSEDELIQILDRLTGGGSSRQVIPITGMGGIGKTTLARNAYVHQITREHFDMRAWITVSQECSVRDILIALLNEIGGGYDKREEANVNEGELGVQLHKKLRGRRYLIVMDDVWSIDVLDKLRQFFPFDNSESRLMITTRISEVAHYLGSTVVTMSFLDEDKSWSLFCQEVFGPQEECPHELEGIGKKIVRSCKGLPLSIVVIGGLLAKSNKTREYWEYIAEDVSSVINLEDDGQCLKVLYSSYVHLPIHLKPCFLYFGIFPEDHEIDVPELIHLWVAEGFLKLKEDKSLEEAANEYLRDLVDRNLVMACSRRYRWEIKETFKIHDLLRELCMMEAQKENFLCISPRSQPSKSQRRLVIPKCSTTVVKKGLQSAASQLARSLIFDDSEGLVPLSTRKLLRVMSTINHFHSKEYTFEDVLHLVNSRYLRFHAKKGLTIPIHTFWNLQTLVMSGNTYLPSEIWTMRQLRHLEADRGFHLPDPHPPRLVNSDRDDDGDFKLENLQTLVVVQCLRCSQEFVKRVPNIKSLCISYDPLEGKRVEWSCYCLNNLQHLTKLESLQCHFPSSTTRNLHRNHLAFPLSLKELTLQRTRLSWEDMSAMIGTLPHLEALRLFYLAFEGLSWNTMEGEFLQPKLLCMSHIQDLSSWTADDASTHFPCLQMLYLEGMINLEEIPLSFADATTLQSIILEDCNYSTIVSAKRIADEAESRLNEDLRVQALCWGQQRQELESLASSNFSITF